MLPLGVSVGSLMMKKADDDMVAPDPYGGETYDYPDYPEMREDFTIDQYYDRYTQDDHAVWSKLMERQLRILPGRACREYMGAFKAMDMPLDRIPRFDDYSDMLMKASGWQIVAVPGLIPTQDFFKHLSEKRFPVTHWIRSKSQMDYLQEPDLFHDFQGHVPLLMNPIFANYMEAYGRGGLKALSLGTLDNIARLYWYTVEFGLIKNEDGLRIYGAGILSSKTESIFCLESSSPNRIAFNLRRLLRTDYRIDDFQETYWVVDNFEQLFEETAGQDFAPIYKEIQGFPVYHAWEIAEGDEVLHTGTREYALSTQS